MSHIACRLSGGLLILASLVLAGCANQPPRLRHPGPYKSPVDALNATDVPANPAFANGSHQPLTNDLGQLRDARSAYRHSQLIQKADRRARQKKCRDNPDAKIVRIQDGTDDPDAVYCQE